MEWLFPAVVASLTTTVLLTLIFFYLYIRERDRALQVWGIGWAFYALRFVFLLWSLRWGDHPALSIGNQMSVLVSGIFLLSGAYIWSESRMARAWFPVFVFCGCWIVAAPWIDLSFQWLTLPTFLVLGAVNFWTGYILLRRRAGTEFGAGLTGWTLIFWGAHKLNYPFLKPVVWFAPWGYLMGAVFSLTAAVGMLLLYFEKTRRLLAQSEARLRQLSDATWEGIAIHDHGVVLIANQQYFEMFGYEPDEVLGRQSIPLIGSPASQDVMRQKIAEGDLGPYEVMGRRKNGDEFPMELRVRIVEYQNRPVRVAAIRDMTEIRNATRELAESRRSYQALFREMPNGFASHEVLCDADGAVVNYRFLAVNPAYEALMGLTADEVLGRTVREVIPDTAPERIASFGHVALTGRPTTLRDYIAHRDRHCVISVYQPAPGQFACIYTDITDRVRAEEALQASEARLEKVNDGLIALGGAFQENIDRLTALCGELFGADCALYNRLDGDQICSISQWRTPVDFPDRRPAKGRMCTDIINRSAERIAAVVIRNLPESDYADTEPLVRRYGLKTYFGYPVACRGQVIGTLCVLFRSDQSPSREDERLLGILGAALGSQEEQRLAKEELAGSQERFQSLFQQIREGIAMIDSHGVVTDWNIFNEALTGILREEAIGRSIGDLIIHLTPEDLRGKEFAQAMTQYQAATATGTLIEDLEPSVLKYHTPDGRDVYVEQTLFALNLGEETHFVSLSRDVTWRQQTEMALRENEHLLRCIADNYPNSQMAIIEQDLKIGFIAGQEMQKSHKTDKDFLGRSVDELYGPDGPGIVEMVRQTFVGEEMTKELAVSGQYQLLRTVPLIDNSGQIHRILFVSENITERKLAENALEKRLVALTRPLDDKTDIEFTDLFVLEEIQRLQDEFAAATGVASIITQTDGIPITRPSRFCRLCDMIRQLDKGLANCLKSDANLGQMNPDGPSIHTCMSGGLWDAGAAIAVGGKHIANWLIGQVRDDTQTEEIIRKYAREIGGDEDAFTQAFHATTEMSREQFEKVAQALFTLANQLSSMAYQNIQQARFITERQQATKALRLSEERFSKAFMASPDFISITKLDDGTYIDVNEAFEQVFGYTRDEVIGKTSRELGVWPEDVDRNAWANRLRSEGKLRNYEMPFRLASGETINTLMSSDVIEIDGRPCVLSVTRDITERKQAEEALRLSEERFSKAFMVGPDAISIARLSDGCFIDINEAFEKMSGYPREAIIGRTSLDLGIWASPEERANWLEYLYSDRSIRDFEMRFRLPSGKEIDALMACELIDVEGEACILTITRDITERKQAEEALRASEERFAKAFQSSPDVIILSRLEDGMILDVNEAFEELFELKREDVIGRTGKSLNLWKDPRQREELVRNLKAGKKIRNHEVEYQLPNGQTVEVLLSSDTLEIGRETCLLVIVRDVTEHKRAEREKGKLEDQLRQSQKMEAVGQLAGGVAHDFNNLLQVIQGYCDMALMEAPPESEIHEDLIQVNHATGRATTLVRQLLAFSRRQVLDMKDVDLNDVIANLTKMIRRVIGEHIELEFLPGYNLGTVRADPGQIEQILMNLCVNARDAMPEGGQIFIETENVRIDQNYCESHPWAQPGRYALLSVTDTGCGMDEHTQANAFEPFFTTKEVGSGTGLGLSTVYGLIKQHEGMVHVYSEPGKGSAFKIYLPLIERNAQSVGPKIVGPVPTGTETLVLAEDEESVRKLTQAILEQAGYQVLSARNGEEALEVFFQNVERIDLVILDVMMPKLGGRGVYNRIHQEYPDVKILFTSGYSMNAIHTNFVLDEGLQLIQKPCQRDELLRKVREVLES